MKKIVIFICIILLTACSNTKIEKELEYNEKVTINVGESLPLVTKYIEGYDDSENMFVFLGTLGKK